MILLIFFGKSKINRRLIFFKNQSLYWFFSILEPLGLERGLSATFPISVWEKDHFEYTGSVIKQTNEHIEVSQKSYVNARLETVDIPKEVCPEDPADQVTRQDDMSTIGALSWLSSQTRPDLQAGVSLAQRRQKCPSYQDVKDTNRLVRMAQAGKDEPLRYTRVAEDLNDVVLLVFHDAAWANAPTDPEHADPEEIEETRGHGVYSQLGHILLMTHRGALQGQPCTTNIVGWKSHACPRVCRSTFAAEVMAGLEGWEEALAFRSFLATALYKRYPYSWTWRCREEPLPDCFPDRLQVGIRQRAQNWRTEGAEWEAVGRRHRGPAQDGLQRSQLLVFPASGEKTLRWLPTTSQLADVLTKVVVDVKSWWSMIRNTTMPFAKSASSTL